MTGQARLATLATAASYTRDEPGECWATGYGQREVHDLHDCEHFLPIAPHEDELHPCGCPVQFVKDCGHQEGCSVVVAYIDTSEGPTFSDGPDYSVNHIS